MVISAARERIRWLSTASSRRVSSSLTPYIAPEAPLIPTISRGLFCDSEEPDGFIYKYGPVALAFQGRNPVTRRKDDVRDGAYGIPQGEASGSGAIDRTGRGPPETR